MVTRRREIGRRRREEIIDAAVAVIAEQGVQHLSLSAIEQRAKMSRGQLTYYFPAKEDIMVAIFDRLITMMKEPQPGDPVAECMKSRQGWDRIRAFLQFMILTPPDIPDFHALQYTFLSQIGHRDDFRERLAGLYEVWRTHMASDLDEEVPCRDAPPISSRTLASFIQALLHGLSIQRVADPQAYDRREMQALVVHLLDRFFADDSSTSTNGYHRPPPRSSSE